MRTIKELTDREASALQKAVRRVAEAVVVAQRLEQQATLARQRVSEAEEAAQDLMEMLVDGGLPEGLEFDAERQALVVPGGGPQENGVRPEVEGALDA